MFIGVLELNNEEGEMFGYYWPQNKGNINGLRNLEEAYEESLFVDNYTFVTDAISEEDLTIMQKASENTYMDLVNYIGHTQWKQLVKSVEGGNDPLYKAVDLEIL